MKISDCHKQALRQGELLWRSWKALRSQGDATDRRFSHRREENVLAEIQQKSLRFAGTVP